MVRLRKLFCSMAGSLVFFLGSAGAGVQVFAAEEETVENIERAEAAIENPLQEDAELLGNGCAYADSGDEFSFSAGKTRYEAGEKIVATIHTDSDDEVVSIEQSADGFRVSKPRQISGDQIEITLTHDMDCAEPHFTLTAKTKSGEVKVRHLYGVFTERGLYVSSASSESAQADYYFDLYSTGTIAEGEFYSLRENLYKGSLTEIIYNSAPSASVLSNYAINTVNATLKWKDDAQITHPLQFTKAEIWDVYHSALLGTVYTNINGEFTFHFENSYVVQLQLRVFAEGENTSVTDLNGTVYRIDSSIHGGVTPGTSSFFDETIDMSTEFGQAFQILQAVNTAARYATEMNGSPLSDVATIYPNNPNSVDPTKDNCYYFNNKIFICKRDDNVHLGYPTSYASWDVIMHEYGHHVAKELEITANPGYSHTFTSNLTELTHRTQNGEEQNSKSEAIRLAWGEAHASLFSGMAQIYFASSLKFIFTASDSQYLSYNKANFDYDNAVKLTVPYREAAGGEACEGSVIAVLWDLFDSANEEHDTLSFGHYSMWQLLKNSKATTMSEFAAYFNQAYPLSTVLDFGKLLSHYGVAVSNIKYQYLGNYKLYHWKRNGTSTKMPNNDFEVVFYDGVGVEIFRRQTSIDSCTIYESDWEKIERSTGTTYSIVIISRQTGSPATGPYYSERVTFNK